MRRSRLLMALLGASVASLTVTLSQAGTIATVQVGSAPMGVAVDGTSGRVFVVNNGSDDVSIIDAATNQEIQRIPVGDSPVDVAINPSTHRAYVANSIGQSISVIDTDALDVAATVPLGRSAMAVDVNPSTNRVYVPITDGSRNTRVAVIDGASNQVATTVTIVGGCPARFVAVDQPRNRLYYASAEHSCPVYFLDGTTHQVTVAFQDGNPWRPEVRRTAVEVDGATGRVYVGRDLSDYRGLSIWDHTGAQVWTLDLDLDPYGIAIDSMAQRVYISGSVYPQEPATMLVFDTARNLLLEAPTPSLFSRGVAVHAASRRVFFTEQHNDALVVFEDDIPEPTIPSAARDLVATPGPRAGEISLSWSPPASTGWTPIRGYRVFRGNSSGSETPVTGTNTTTYTDTGLPTNTEFFYRVVPVNGIGEGPASDEVSARTPRVPSGECAEGRALFDGAVEPVRLRLRLLTTGAETALCFHAALDTWANWQHVVREYGAKVTLAPASEASSPEVDENADACATTSGNESLSAPIGGHLGDADHPALRYEIRTFSRRDLGTWLCIKASGETLSVSRRVIVQSPASSLIEHDPPGHTPAPPPSTGSASRLCGLRAGPELFTTETADGGRIWLSTWNESATRTHLCIRREGSEGKAGGRITIDTKGAPDSTVDALVSSHDEGEDPGFSDSRCPRNVYQVSYLGVAHSDPANPSHVCVGYPVASLFSEGPLGPTYTYQRVVVVTIGTESLAPPPEITWTPDE